MYIVGERDRENTNYTTHGFTLRLKKCKSHPSPFLLDSINPPTHALSLSPKFHIHLVLIAPSISLTLSLSLSTTSPPCKHFNPLPSAPPHSPHSSNNPQISPLPPPPMPNHPSASPFPPRLKPSPRVRRIPRSAWSSPAWV